MLRLRHLTKNTVMFWHLNYLHSSSSKIYLHNGHSLYSHICYGEFEETIFVYQTNSVEHLCVVHFQKWHYWKPYILHIVKFKKMEKFPKSNRSPIITSKCRFDLSIVPNFDVLLSQWIYSSGYSNLPIWLWKSYDRKKRPSFLQFVHESWSF